MPRVLEGHAIDRRRRDLGAPLLASAPRIGVCLHYDASVTDRGALAWLLDPRCTLGYNVLVWDDGQAFEIIDLGRRAPHAGKTRSSDPARLPYPDNQANSAFYGIAVAATAGDQVTQPQLGTVIRLTARIFEHHGWPLRESWRLTDHYAEAWPRKRKLDVLGYDPDRPYAPGNQHRPVLDMEHLRAWLAQAR